MATRVVTINQPVKLMIVRQKDFNDRAKGYEILEPNQKWKSLKDENGILLKPSEIIRMAHRMERHILWNPILARRWDSSILQRAEKIEKIA